AIDNSWTENYGAGGAPNGSNIDFTSPGGPVAFYYDHSTHYTQNTAMGPIITAPGSFQSKLGCSNDWDPSCMRPWLQDPTGSGVYTWSSASIPAGDYQFKIAEGLNWTVNYGAGGTPGGNNIDLTVPSDGVVVTISFNATTHEIKAFTSKAGPAPDLKKQKAIWVDASTLAWPASDVPSGVDPSMLNWRFYWSASGSLSADAEALVGSDAKVASLTYDPAGLSAATVAAHSELKGYLALKLDKKTATTQVKGILTDQVAVGMFDNLGSLLDATGVQIPIVLDSLYARAAADRHLGVSFSGGQTSFAVWAPTAQKVTLLTWPAGSPDGPVTSATRTPMRLDSTTGIWTAAGHGLENVRYLYEVKVYAPTVAKMVTNDVTDPYSDALTLDSTRSVAVNLTSPAWQPSQWAKTASPKLAQSVDSTIYELQVRDFSAGDPSVPASDRGSYMAFADNGDGTLHLKELAKAGLNTVHLLPTFDIASIEEDKSKEQTPPCDLSSYPPDSQEQQACIAKIQNSDAYNWGYDPLHYMAPEGSYANSNAAADGGNRVAQFRTMVGALHADGLRVVLDQVFNHTAASGEDPKSVLDQVVPGYYQREDPQGKVYTSTCCQDTATEHAMMQKIMVDSVVTWAKDYKVDGFRFDLMGHASVANMKAVRAALDQLTLRKDGVDGKSIYLYGEGWNFGEVADNALFTQATQGQLDGTGIGAFNDRLRDGVRGGGPFDNDPLKQGFGSGEATDPNGDASNADASSNLKRDTDLVELGLAGNLKSFTFTNTSGTTVNGTQVDYNGSPAGFASQPSENVNYVDAHDNETIWDSLTYKLPLATSMSDRIRMNTMSLATTVLSQSPSFWDAGADLLRSKSFDRNSYNSGDWFNQISWTGADNGFGHGLPMAADNSSKWSYQQPLLANPALKPSAAQVQEASAQAQELLKLRFSTPLFRLGSASQIAAKVSFPANGTSAEQPGVIVMRIDDTLGRDADPSLNGLVVVFNATPDRVVESVPGVSGNFSLSPVQANGSDPVVKAASYHAGSFTVPARTVAVFVQK
ncbi:MAG TPA: pullulanase-type alpha-1,6-glucosidase, partial [Propionibacteriaceae bacterium]|nr:pullulanase-type alpha-1,6-glucosidase [Propionibacteriaceae bacterium]